MVHTPKIVHLHICQKQKQKVSFEYNFDYVYGVQRYVYDAPLYTSEVLKQQKYGKLSRTTGH